MEEEAVLKKIAKERIAVLTKERDDFVVAANQEVAKYNGAIGEWMRVLQPASEGNEPGHQRQLTDRRPGTTNQEKTN